VRILFHTAPPQMPTGYATQAGLIIPRLAALGHEVAVSASAGIESHQSRWRNFRVYGKTPYADFGEDVVQGHARDFGADLVITFLCTWILNPLAWRDLRVIHLTPVDCEPMSVRDYRVISGTGGTPAAVSRWGAERGGWLIRCISPTGWILRFSVPPGTGTGCGRHPAPAGSSSSG